MSRRTRRVAAALLVSGAVLANAAFAALGSAFDYPNVLSQPAADVLASFRANQGVVVTWFSVLALSSALLAPIALVLRHLSDHPAMRWATVAGVAAAVVQVIGLSRWPLLVPGYAADAARGGADAARAVDAFSLASRLLGTIIGETLGYLLTAAWTVGVVLALDGRLAGRTGSRMVSLLGLTGAVLIVSGVLVPLGVPGVDLANFAGYVLWSLWLVVLAVLLLRSAPRADRLGGPQRAGAGGSA